MNYETVMPSESKRLEVFQDLFLRGRTADRPALRRALLDRVSPPWHHAEKEERELLTYASENPDVLVFEREAGGGLAAAGLVLWSRPDGYAVTNIVPRKVHELDYGAYNAVLQDFLQRVGAAAAQQAGFSVETTPPLQSLEEWLTPQSAEALRRFSGAANKATGSSHPVDGKRWVQFLLQVHADSRRLDSEQLFRWLVEIEGWSEEKAHDLVVEYEFALALLDAYEQIRT